MVGVAYVDIISCQFQLCQFVDSMNLINLESVIVQLAAKECLVVASSDGDSRATSLRQLLDRSNVAITERKKGSFLLCVCFNLPARSRLIWFGYISLINFCLELVEVYITARLGFVINSKSTFKE